MKIYDISQEISQDMVVYGDTEKVCITELSEIQKGSSYNMTRISMTGHTGTHADAPLHFIDGGLSLDSLPLDCFYGMANLIHVKPVIRDVTKEDLLPLDIRAGDILLLNTGQKALKPEAAAYLAEKRIKTLGIDSLSVDAFDSIEYTAHLILLENNIPIVEGLLLDNIPEGLYEFSALPLKIKNGNGSPVRAILVDRHIN